MNLAESASKAVGSGAYHAAPYVILIAIVGVTGWVQQKQIQGRTPNAQVPQQQQAVMKIMPFFLPIISIGLPAGLVLDFVVSNTYRVAQQWFIGRSIYGPAEAEQKVGAVKADSSTSSGTGASSSVPDQGWQCKAEAGSDRRGHECGGGEGRRGQGRPGQGRRRQGERLRAARPRTPAGLRRNQNVLPSPRRRRSRRTGRQPRHRTAPRRPPRRRPSGGPTDRTARPSRATMPPPPSPGASTTGPEEEGVAPAVEWVETTGRTLEEAKDAALDQLGVHEDDAEFEVVDEPKSGLFGLTRREARVRAQVRPTAPRPKVERRDRRRRSTGSGGRSSGKGERSRGGRSSAASGSHGGGWRGARRNQAGARGAGEEPVAGKGRVGDLERRQRFDHDAVI